MTIDPAQGSSDPASILHASSSLATIQVRSVGGDGGYAEGDFALKGANGNDGGAGADAYLEINGATIDTEPDTDGQNTGSPGIEVSSLGGNGSLGGQSGDPHDSANGGAGGAGGPATLVFTSGTNSITAAGSYNPGALVESVGGSGGAAGAGGGGGDAGAAGAGGASTLIVSGGTLDVTTSGTGSHGLAVQSISGTGGSGNAENFSLIYGAGDAGGAGADADTATVTLNAETTVGTSGDGAMGVFAQSIGGAGGNGGPSTSLFGVGGDGGGAGGGGTVTITNPGTVTTSGDGAFGLYGLSIGGGGGLVLGSAIPSEYLGGGTGGGGNGAFGIGGSGGSGGDGGSVTIETTGTVKTTGSNAHAVVASSIGGGGGAGGGAFSVAPFVSVAVGGSGGSGGNAGTVEVNPDATAAVDGAIISTSSVGAYGIKAMSVGGGGGDGGGAVATAFAAPITLASGGAQFGAAISIGGSGGAGGDGGEVHVNNVADLSTADDESIGIYAASIGGGGGTGGHAASYTVGLVRSPGTVSLNASVSVGGSGEGGGSGDEVYVTNYGSVSTTGMMASAIHAQSIGGGGGNGGNSQAVAASLATENSVGSSLTVAVGGSAGGGGDGDEVHVTNDGSISTAGQFSHGIIAQSIGGGGGTGGLGAAYSIPGISLAAANGIAAGVAVGGSGGPATGSALVKVINSGSITIEGPNSSGIIAQSIGGGGGYGGGAQASSNADGPQLSVSVGGSGGSGGAGGDVTVDNQAGAVIKTSGHGGFGIQAQSIGGGGGAGGAASAGNDLPVEILDEADALHQDATTIQKFLKAVRPASATVSPEGEASEPEEPEGIELPNVALDISVGGSGGVGGIGGTIEVSNEGTIWTEGDTASAIFAQSVGGGGGFGGGASAELGQLSGSVNVGGGGGAGNNGGQVTVTNSGEITTAGNFSPGIEAQSVGGGGGTGGAATSEEGIFLSAALTVEVGGDAGNASNGGEVDVTNTGIIKTQGNHSHGIFAQSVGGGGGHTYFNGQSFDDNGMASVSGAPLYETPGLSTSVATAEGGEAEDESKGLNFTFGGNGSNGGNGGLVDIEVGGTITTMGDDAFAVFGQSVGGGGGTGAVGSGYIDIPLTFSAGGDGNSGIGGNVEITLDDGAVLSTEGTGASALVAQTVAGGGGHVAGLGTELADAMSFLVSNGTAHTGGSVSVTTAADATVSIKTTGYGAHGIFAQSTAGGGGSIGSYAGHLSLAAIPTEIDLENWGSGGAVTVDVVGDVVATGAHSVAVYAESSGLGYVTNGTISVTTNGTVTGGTGSSAAGIAILGGNQSNTITIEGGTVSAGEGGYAVAAAHLLSFDDPASVTLTNRGTLIGNIDLGFGSNVFDNSGTFYPGEIVVVGTNDDTLHYVPPTVQALQGNWSKQPFWGEGSFQNTGHIDVAGPGVIGSTEFQAVEFSQIGGSLGLDWDPANGMIDTIDVTNGGVEGGTLSFGGTVVPTLLSLPTPSQEAATFLTTDLGSVTLNASPVDTLATQYSLNQVGSTFTVGATIDYTTPESLAGTSAQDVAQHIQSVYTAGGGSGGLSATLVALANETDEDDYVAMMKEMSGDVASATTGVHSSDKAQMVLETQNSCPVVNAATGRLTEESCVYLKPIGRFASLDDDSATSGVDTVYGGVAVGGQKLVGDGWYVGGVVSYGQSRAESDDGRFESHADDYAAGVVVKKRIDDVFQIALAGTYMFSDLNHERTTARFTTTGGRVARSDAVAHTLAGRVRVSYDGAVGPMYVKPMADLDVVWTSVPAYSEHGAGAFNLAYEDTQDVNVAVRPAVEVGTQVVFDGAKLRAYGRLGLTYWSDREFNQRARFAAAPVGATAFDNSFEGARLLADATLGAELVTSGGLELRAQYDVSAGGDSIYQAISGRVGFRF
ncbi:autotransporter outer membrane beta-barrel domain-containing protein [Acuticoccus mangrovi]|uniref:Autotransporter outer membrane beta-barrel domain-containing protein n=1 Tax=Acuticoccus mangrovi TaxID=2796142 RepID=A0A934IL67_9HYPH|nr:autotransporter outer membrane beta-barrel domain-containing protein [Acuticoccus mangrovi]MBJ3774381.1 autotransporter outer membrane beta-barrel domain-containing protein [Acuticoccus mangrovi]